MMPIKRARRKQHFTIIPNQSLEDDGLSFKARGLLAYMLSKPDDWEFYEAELAKHTIDGKAAIGSALKELEGGGYLIRQRTRTPTGTLAGTNWIVYDTPQPKTDYQEQVETPLNQQSETRDTGISTFPPKTDYPMLEKPTLDNPQLLSTDSTKNLLDQETTTTTTRAGSLESIKTFAEKNGFGDLVPDPSNRVWANLNDFLSEFVEHGASEAQARDLVLNALNDAISHNARTYAYATKILNRYSNSHFTSVEQAEASAKAYQAAHSKQSRSKQGLTPHIEHERDDIDDRIVQEMADRQARIESGQETLPDDLPF